MGFDVLTTNTSPLDPVAEIAPKSPFLCVNRSLIRRVFLRVPVKELSVKCEHMKVEMILAVEC